METEANHEEEQLMVTIQSVLNALRVAASKPDPWPRDTLVAAVSAANGLSLNAARCVLDALTAVHFMVCLMEVVGEVQRIAVLLHEVFAPEISPDTVTFRFVTVDEDTGSITVTRFGLAVAAQLLLREQWDRRAGAARDVG